jgi:hypothetical protein
MKGMQRCTRKLMTELTEKSNAPAASNKSIFSREKTFGKIYSSKAPTVIPNIAIDIATNA